MPVPRHIIRLFPSILICAGLLITGSRISAYAQQPATNDSDACQSDEKIYQKADAEAAIKELRAATEKNMDDICAWHYLGLLLSRPGDMSGASKAHEKAAMLGQLLLANQVRKLQYPIDYSPLVMYKLQLTQAAKSAEAYIATSKNLTKLKAAQWQERVEYLWDSVEIANPQNSRVFSGKDVETKARIISKPEPQYTEEARAHNVGGTVMLRAIFAADGRVRLITPMVTLPHGLTERAIAVARQIKFTPATKDGHPVSMFIQLEYNFSLH